MLAKLILEDGSVFEGLSFGADSSVSGEVVFSTGMVGYPESFTDPSFLGQILILTYPLIGNYGVPQEKYWESDGIKISGLVVSNYIDTPSHFQSEKTLSQWLKDEKIPAIIIKDTRFLTQKIRNKGTMLGKIINPFDDSYAHGKEIKIYDPNKDNLVDKVSTKKVVIEGKGDKTIVLFDCGVKRNIVRSFVKRGVKVIIVPWDYDPFDDSVILNTSTPLSVNSVKNLKETRSSRLVSQSSTSLRMTNPFDAIAISNGPGDPKMTVRTISTIRKALERKIPTFGICLGNQILALAGGGDTYKLKFGHRSQNQPCIMEGTSRCYITVQNHGFAVGRIPKGFKPWFTNANDGSNEGIIHGKLPFMSVQFHPEANPGPKDTEWIFDYFLERIS